MVFVAESLDEAEKLAAADHFVPAGVFASYEVKRWRIAINNSGAEI